MIFGRKKKQKLDEEDLGSSTTVVTPEDEVLDEDEAGEATPEVKGAGDKGAVDKKVAEELEADAEEAEEPDDEATEEDEFDEDDALVDDELREDGPFDITEVDLDADEIERLDFGCLVLTPFETMQIQLQVDQATNTVQSALVMAEQSALEVALFAAPARTSMVADVAEDMVRSTTAAEGEATISEGPFGPEIRRVIPVEGPDGEQAYHVSRTWFAQGPRWLLRGVLMGEAGMAEDFSGAGELLFEFFCNVVVRRGDDPMVPGDLIAMTLPEGLVEAVEE